VGNSFSNVVRKHYATSLQNLDTTYESVQEF
jgi:hypothetical protein